MIYLRLVKVFFKENFSLRRLIGTDISKNKKKAFLLGLLIIYALGVFVFSFGYLFFDLGKVLDAMNMLWMLLMFVFLYASAISVMFVLLRANGYLFRYKDYPILAPLPIPLRTVLFAKTTVMMVMVYFPLAIMCAPIAFSYFYFFGFDILRFIVFLIGFLLIPLVPVIIFSFISLLIARMTARFRRSNLLNIILMIAVFIGAMLFSFSLSFSGEDNPLLGQQDFIRALGEIYLPMQWFVDAVHHLNIVSLLLLAATHLLPMLGFIVLIQKMAHKTNQKSMTVVTRKNARKAVSQMRPVFESLIIKEVRKFFSVPIYAVNCGFGPILMIILSVASLFYKSRVQSFLETYIGAGIPIEIILLIVIAFSTAMVYTSAVSLSLEGKNFWVIKSMPIPPALIMNAKMAFNVLLTVPVAIVSLILFMISFSLGSLTVLMMILVLITISLLTSAFDSFINLHFPKFEFMNDTEVVKQSVGALIAIFGGFGFIAIDGVIFYFLNQVISLELTLLVISMVNLVLFGLFFLI
ncbi:MAG: hypothetical protein PHO96_00415, partial [Candidatus Izemoplasmatales bacterium]|nr:hypothetical protein [Candidatus Izemoplasmatales bacterium]